MSWRRGAGADLVIAMGGDGTYNEVVNGLADGVPLGVLPAGATSVFARQLGWPRGVEDAARGLAGAIAARSLRRIGLGRLDGRRFTFSAGMGLEADAMRLVDEQRSLRSDRRRPSDLRVVGAALRALRADGWSLPARMTVRDGGRQLRCAYLAVANAHPYTYFGPLSVRTTPRAGPDTALDAAVAGELRTRDLWRLGVYGLVWPRHASGGDRRVAYLHDRAHLTVECDEPVSVQLDGEYLGRVTSADIRYEPDAISVYVPPAGDRARGPAPAGAAAGS